MQVTIGGHDYDSYADVDFATVFLGADIARATGWALLNPDTQGRGLVSASRLLLGLPWCVDPVPLPTDADQNPVIQQAASMLAADLIAKPRMFADASTNSNVKAVRAGSASVDFFRPVEGRPPLPMAIWKMLLNAWLVGCVDGGDGGGPVVSGITTCDRPLGGRGFDDWPWTQLDYD